MKACSVLAPIAASRSATWPAMQWIRTFSLGKKLPGRQFQKI
jgi:hypothetical protein